MGSIICPKCKIKGYLVRERERYLRVAHNDNRSYKRRTRFCYLGEEKKYVRRLEALSRIYPEQNLGELVDKIKKKLPEKPEEEPSTEIVSLIRELKRLYRRMRILADDSEHKLRYRHNCPYCKKTIAVYARRIGTPPFYAYNDIRLDTYRYY